MQQHPQFTQLHPASNRSYVIQPRYESNFRIANNGMQIPPSQPQVSYAYGTPIHQAPVFQHGQVVQQQPQIVSNQFAYPNQPAVRPVQHEQFQQQIHQQPQQPVQEAVVHTISNVNQVNAKKGGNQPFTQYNNSELLMKNATLQDFKQDVGCCAFRKKVEFQTQNKAANRW